MLFESEGQARSFPVGRRSRAVFAGLLALAIAGCSAPGRTGGSAPSNVGTAASTSAATPAGTPSPASIPPTIPAARAPVGPAGSIEQVVQQVSPGVVKVDASAQAQTSGPFGFGPAAQASGTGTGILLDTQGHILTNNHVVTLESSTPANSITVTLANGRTAPAKLLGRDEQTDLAVIQVDASQLPGTGPLQFADPGSVKVGEPVVAVGYALDLAGDPTVTSGIVSAVNRAIDEPSATISGAIQTDTAINPGNSGGPLVDLSGHVIGINAAGLTGTPDQPAQGLNFAISAATAKPVADALISKGQVTRGYMGVQVTNVTPQLAQDNSLAVKSGAGVADVASGSPAAQAGLRMGDIITKVGSTTIQNLGDLTTALTENGPGTKVPVIYYRDNNQQTATVTLGTRPAGG